SVGVISALLLALTASSGAVAHGAAHLRDAHHAAHDAMDAQRTAGNAATTAPDHTHEDGHDPDGHDHEAPIDPAASGVAVTPADHPHTAVSAPVMVRIMDATLFTATMEDALPLVPLIVVEAPPPHADVRGGDARRTTDPPRPRGPPIA
ncbi:MAG: hypothetical protein P2975_07630, partial [Gemmatimonadota bacterium]|nr:hypothetical protein [Gemmatimonadota bacterium]